MDIKYKFMGMALGIGIGVLGLSSSTPASVQRYLENKGYSRVTVQVPEGSCGKGSRLFPFKAIKGGNQPAAGMVCAGSFNYFNSIRE